ncbi:tRNA dihydrouridine(20/20a) synthase DusA [Hirschia maritima]|uniref:tRNA dihydrouridine(20/20a) synthase DusA n=1 Tax=Hirschia maritima TaxID=1121961 RepID=UPI0003755CB9|nr:tRNA dihydrouridine(20/20a) synthase DusA [Hirschia maritima]
MYEQSYRFSVAPMMDWTDRHCRMFHRAFTKRALLYSEMVTADALIHGDLEYLIGFNPEEQPLALQLGGSDPEKLAKASKIGEDFGYSEVNLNCGCPSDRVQSGAFGACLMARPQHVAECISAMKNAVDIPVTVKCRIGIDDDEPRERLFEFVETVAETGCHVFIVHARKAWLKGLSPKENRDIPPLDYDLVADLKKQHPELTISLNGGLGSLEAGVEQLPRFDGIMLGRAAYHTPGLLGSVDRVIFGEDVEDTDEFEALINYRPYILEQLENGIHLHAMTRHMMGLFNGKRGAKKWRRFLSENAPGAKGVDTIKIVDEAATFVHQNDELPSTIDG